MARTKSETIKEVTTQYLSTLNLNNLPSPAEIQADILDETATAFDIENAARPKGSKWTIPDKLNAMQIADIMLKIYPICNIILKASADSNEKDMLSIYQNDGDNAGIYVEDETAFWRIVRNYNYGIKESEFREVLLILRKAAPRRKRCEDKDLIAVNNGIFDYKSKQFLPFTPDIVFTAKSKVNFNPNATNVVIHNPDDNTDWDVESWMDELFDNSEMSDLMWKIIGAIIRPNVPWDKSAWFYSESGNNGKGTLCELMRQICGKGTYTSIPLSSFSKEFMLEPLVHSTAIIVDENDVGTYIDKAANLKAVVTGDVLQLNRKHKTPIAFQFKGFMVQCLNELPRIRDKSDSFYRRQLFVPFNKCFTGTERKYIKHEYLHRQDVLEYVLYKVLMMDYYELPVPQVCKDILEEYKEFNDPVRQFMAEVMDKLVWDFVPFSFLSDLYIAWYKKNVGSEKNLSTASFKKEFINLLKDYPNWISEGSKPCRPGNKMAQLEPLIEEYKLTNWMNPMYMNSTDINKKCMPALKTTYNGIRRV